jgi:hypothetical protein
VVALTQNTFCRSIGGVCDTSPHRELMRRVSLCQLGFSVSDVKSSMAVTLPSLVSHYPGKQGKKDKLRPKPISLAPCSLPINQSVRRKRRSSIACRKGPGELAVS